MYSNVKYEFEKWEEEASRLNGCFLNYYDVLKALYPDWEENEKEYSRDINYNIIMKMLEDTSNKEEFARTQRQYFRDLYLKLTNN